MCATRHTRPHEARHCSVSRVTDARLGGPSPKVRRRAAPCPRLRALCCGSGPPHRCSASRPPAGDGAPRARLGSARPSADSAGSQLLEHSTSTALPARISVFRLNANAGINLIEPLSQRPSGNRLCTSTATACSGSRRPAAGLTCHGAVGRPRRDGRPPLVEEDVGRLRAHLLLRQLLHVAVVEAVPEAVHGVLTVGCQREGPSAGPPPAAPPTDPVLGQQFEPFLGPCTVPQNQGKATLQSAPRRDAQRSPNYSKRVTFVSLLETRHTYLFKPVGLGGPFWLSRLGEERHWHLAGRGQGRRGLPYSQERSGTRPTGPGSGASRAAPRAAPAVPSSSLIPDARHVTVPGSRRLISSPGSRSQ